MKIITKTELYEMMVNIFCAEYDDGEDIQNYVETVYGEVVDGWNDEYGRDSWNFENGYNLDEDDFLKYWENL